MHNDKTTLKDLSIFLPESRGDIFSLLDHTTTHAGSDALKKHIQYPPGNFDALKKLQDTIKFWTLHTDAWPQIISNGTLVMLEKFFETADAASSPPGGLQLLFGPFLQKLFNRNEYFFTQFSISHLADFINGCRQLLAIREMDNVPELLQQELDIIAKELEHPLTNELVLVNPQTPYRELARLSFRARREMKQMTYKLMGHYALLDAWQSMARATVKQKWTFPVLQSAVPICYRVHGLYHPLLSYPVAYDIDFEHNNNFLLLTGANMSGKTTLMRALGVGALLAHLGMGVPAKAMHISFLHGIITNMHVEDDLLKGESFFFAEVQRMKHTAQKLLQNQSHLVLMDELFKGTNIHDAYECTRAVIEGLLKRPDHLMVLSTHLYEVAQHFEKREGMLFAYFVTKMNEDGSYYFTYELKKGISNDRIGYRILQQEGVLDLLQKKADS